MSVCAVGSCHIPVADVGVPFCTSHWQALPVDLKGLIHTEAGRERATKRAVAHLILVDEARGRTPTHYRRRPQVR